MLQRFLGAYDPLGAASLADLKASVAVAAVAADATHSAPTEHERVMEELARRRVAASARYERSSDRYELALGNSVNKPPGGAAAASQLPGPVVPAPAGGAATVGAGTLARLMLREEGFQWTSAGCAELEASGLSRAVFGPAAKALAAADGSAAVASLRTSPAAAALPPPAGGGGSAPGCMPLSPPRQLLPVHGDTAGMAGAAPALVGASAAAAGGRGPPPRDVDMPPSDGRNAPFLAATGASAEGSAMRDDDGGAGLMSATF